MHSGNQMAEGRTREELDCKGNLIETPGPPTES